MFHDRIGIGLPSPRVPTIALYVAVAGGLLTCPDHERRDQPTRPMVPLAPNTPARFVAPRGVIWAEPALGRDDVRLGAAQATPLVDQGALVVRAMIGSPRGVGDSPVVKVADPNCGERYDRRICLPFDDVRIVERSGDLVLVARIGARWWTYQLATRATQIWALDVYDMFGSPAPEITIVMTRGHMHAQVHCSVGSSRVPSCVLLQLGSEHTHERMDMDRDGSLVLTGWRDDVFVHERYIVRFE